MQDKKSFPRSLFKWYYIVALIALVLFGFFCYIIFPFFLYGDLPSDWGRADSVAISPSGNIYLSRLHNYRLYKLDANGHYQAALTQAANQNNRSLHEGQLALDQQGNIFITQADTTIEGVTVLDGDGNFLYTWGGRGSGDGKFERPSAITLDQNNNVYVTDDDNYRVQKFDQKGHFLLKWGSRGVNSGQFKTPRAITSDRQGYIYVGDSGNHCVQVFDAQGNFVSRWGQAGANPGQINSVDGLAFDPVNKQIFLADSANSRISKFDQAGKYLGMIGESARLVGPQSLALDRQNNLYVIDKGLDLLKFDPSGHLIWDTQRGDWNPPGSSSSLLEVGGIILAVILLYSIVLIVYLKRKAKHR